MAAKFKKTSKVFLQAFSRPLVIYLTLVGNAFLLVCTVLVYVLEKDVNPSMASFFNVLWWAVSTITTVGFGDVVPMTHAGRAIGMVLMYSGTILFITFTSLVATFWISRGLEEELQPLEAEMQKEEIAAFSMEHSLKNIQSRMEAMEARLSQIERMQRQLSLTRRTRG